MVVAHHGTDRMDFDRFDIAEARICNVGLHFVTRAAAESRIDRTFAPWRRHVRGKREGGCARMAQAVPGDVVGARSQRGRSARVKVARNTDEDEGVSFRGVVGGVRWRDFMNNEFDKYYVATEPGYRERAIGWATAIGLQDVDGLKPSK